MSGSPGELGRARAAHGSCTLGAAGSTRRKDTSPPSPPECLLQTGHNQTPGGREPGRGGPQGSGPRKSSGGRDDADQLAHRTCGSSRGSAPTRSRECRQLHPFQAIPRALGPTWGRALPGRMEAGFGEPGKAGSALRGRFPVVWRFVNREVGRSGQ